MKKFLCFVLILVLLISSIGCFSTSAEEYTVPDTFVYGDIDFDAVVTVRDATAIQKGLAGITYLTGVQKYLADPDNQGVTVKSATAIQKFLAGIGDVPKRIGSAVEMTSTNEFSSRVPETADYRDNCIVVLPVTDRKSSYTYSLADFPEYEFESMKTIGAEERNYIAYVLYFKNPDRDNVLEAIKALDYRANLDLKTVEPDYYLYLD